MRLLDGSGLYIVFCLTINGLARGDVHVPRMIITVAKRSTNVVIVIIGIMVIPVALHGKSVIIVPSNVKSQRMAKSHLWNRLLGDL